MLAEDLDEFGSNRWKITPFGGHSNQTSFCGGRGVDTIHTLRNTGNITAIHSGTDITELWDLVRLGQLNIGAC